jgi:hypothetical protein
MPARRGTWALLLAAGCLLTATAATAADLQPASVAAFDRYARATEARLDEESRGRGAFLWLDRQPEPKRREAVQRLERGDILVIRSETLEGGQRIDVPSALSHHWVGTMFARGVTLDRVAAVMQGYPQYDQVYRPAVRQSRTISRDGDHFKVFLQLFMHKVISVVLNTENDVRYRRLSDTRMQVRSIATRIAEVDDAGTPQEREKPVGRDNGFLWRFNNYCALEQRAEGTYVQCESISISRRIPMGLGWLIGPFVNDVPRESLEFTLKAMREAVNSRSGLSGH